MVYRHDSVLVSLTPMLEYVHQFLIALVFSIVVESVAVLVLCMLLKKEKSIVWLAALGTVCTIPYVWFVFPTIFWYSASATLVMGEIGAFVFEAGIYKIFGKISWRDALVFSLIANAASYFLGMVLLS